MFRLYRPISCVESLLCWWSLSVASPATCIQFVSCAVSGRPAISRIRLISLCHPGCRAVCCPVGRPVRLSVRLTPDSSACLLSCPPVRLPANLPVCPRVCASVRLTDVSSGLAVAAPAPAERACTGGHIVRLAVLFPFPFSFRDLAAAVRNGRLPMWPPHLPVPRTRPRADASQFGSPQKHATRPVKRRARPWHGRAAANGSNGTRRGEWERGGGGRGEG